MEQKQLSWYDDKELVESVAVKGAELPDGDVALVLDRETATAMLGIYQNPFSALTEMSKKGCGELGLSFNQINDGSVYCVLSKVLRSDVEEWMRELI